MSWSEHQGAEGPHGDLKGAVYIQKELAFNDNNRNRCLGTTNWPRCPKRIREGCPYDTLCHNAMYKDVEKTVIIEKEQ